MCRVAEKIQYCRFELPNGRAYNLRPDIRVENGKISYFGESLDSGQCGVKIENTLDEYNGPIKCTMGVYSQPHEVAANTTLIVASKYIFFLILHIFYFS